MSRLIHPVAFHVLRDARTGFGRNTVVVDGLPSNAQEGR
jgi:hypothetical protein